MMECLDGSYTWRQLWTVIAERSFASPWMTTGSRSCAFGLSGPSTGTGGLWDDPAQRPRQPIHQRRISESAGAIRCGSKHKRYGPLLRQRQDGELFSTRKKEKLY